MANRVKEKLLNGDTAIVLNPNYASPNIVEFLGKLGFDGFFIDCQRHPITYKDAEEMHRAAKGIGLTSIVRPESNENWAIARYLTLGVGGIMLTYMDNAELVQNAINQVRQTRAHDYADILVIVNLQTLQGLQNLEEIVSIDGVDVVFVGPGDLSGEMGYPGDIYHPEVRSAIERVLEVTIRNGKIPGALVDVTNVQYYHQKGVRYLYHHINNFLTRGADEFFELVRNETSVSQ